MILLKENIRIQVLARQLYPRFWLYTDDPNLYDTELIRWVMHADIDFDQSHVLEWSARELHKRMQIHHRNLNIYTDYMSDTITCMKHEAILF